MDEEKLEAQLAELMEWTTDAPDWVGARIEEQLAIRDKELNIVIDNSTEHEMQRYYLAEQLTAAEEQLAEMREAAELYIAQITSGVHPACRAAEQTENRLRQALSAAPKRGRVLFHERVDLMDYAPSHETFMYGGGPGGPECKSGEYMGAIRKRLLENPQVGVIVEGFTVTVREAE